MKFIRNILALGTLALATLGCNVEHYRQDFHAENVKLFKDEDSKWVRADIVSSYMRNEMGCFGYEIAAKIGRRKKVIAWLRDKPEQINMKDVDNDGDLDLVVERVMRTRSGDAVGSVLTYVNDNGDFSRVKARSK
jgi:hypothetical protein